MNINYLKSKGKTITMITGIPKKPIKYTKSQLYKAFKAYYNDEDIALDLVNYIVENSWNYPKQKNDELP